ncbi:MAG: polysaccharide pyruvyl transferase CsaB [Clostridia bacterium]|nr:polysaccharide pyruvyl transferase CsaB [Clostridia bacterium]
MKLISICGGNDTESVRAALAPFGLVQNEIVLHSSEKKDAVRLGRQMAEQAPTAVICFGETGLSAGLFVLKKCKKAKIPLLAAISSPTDASRLAPFDAILCTDESVRTALLATDLPAHKLCTPAEVLTRGLTALKPQKRNEVVISGSYGLGNFGDDAMLAAILAEVRKHNPWSRITVLSRDPAATRKTHRVDTLPSFALPALIARLRKAQLLISGGGTLLTDLTSTLSLLYYLTIIRLAHRFGARVLLYSCGIGPFAAETNKKRVARTLNRAAEAIVLRDARSAQELAVIGVTKPIVLCTRDAAFDLTHDPNADAPQFPFARYALFALRPWNRDGETIAEIRETARRLWCERGLAAVFLPMETPKDLVFAQALTADLETPHAIFSEVGSFAEAFAAIAKAAVVISMRLHAMIAAGAADVPTVGIAYDIKISGYLDHVGCDFGLAYESLTANALFDQVDRALAYGHGHVPPTNEAGKAALAAMLTDKTKEDAHEAVTRH